MKYTNNRSEFISRQTNVWVVLMLVCFQITHAQRFMRQGFSNQEDFSAEMKLEDDDAAVGMTREMFLMQDLSWQLPAIEYADSCDAIVSRPSPVVSSALRNHIDTYLGGRKHRQPVSLQLFKKRGKFGLRAVGTMDNGKKLRAFWRQATIAPTTATDSTTAGKKTTNFLKLTYDDAVRTRLFTVEFEIQLPPLSKKEGKVLPSIVYQVPIESGSMNPKAIIPRGVGKVFLYPSGHPEGKRSAGKTVKPIEIGTCRVGVVQMRPGLVDPSWSRGRPIFRKGQLAGIM